MSPRSSLACAVLLLAAPAWAGNENARVRGLDPDAVRILETARAGSPAVRQMLDRLERSDMITYVQFARRLERPRAVTAIISSVPEVRYVLIVISTFTSEADRFLLLGHELQHAVELADAPEVRDEEGMRRLYGRIGWRENVRTFETAAAQQMGRRVQYELQLARPEPVVASAR